MWCEEVRRIALAMVVLIFTAMVVFPVQGDVQLAQLQDVKLDPVEIKAIMSLDKVTTLNIRARATNQGSSGITSLSFRIDSLDVEIINSQANGTSTTSSSELQNRYTEVIVFLSSPLQENESVWVELEVEATDFQQDRELSFDLSKYLETFVFYVRPLVDFSNFTFIAVLPQDALLSRESVVPLFPAANSNYTDGSSIAFVWYIESLQVGQERAFIIKYQFSNLQSGPLGSFLVESILIAVLGVIGGIILTLGGPKLYQRLRRIGTVKFVGITSEEREVLDVIQRKGGSCPQKDLYTEFDMSQAKVSLILNNLEERGIVRRFREGRENVVHIMED